MSADRTSEGARPGQRRIACLATGLLVTLAGCDSLLGPPPPAPHSWTLDAADAGGLPAGRPGAPAAGATTAAAIVIGVPRAAAGFDTDRIMYVRETHRLEPYAENQWVDTPSRMLLPLLSGSLARTGAFAAVLTVPSSTHGGWLLETLVVRLQHEVPEGRVRFTLRATLVDRLNGTAVAAREFEATAPTPSTNPAGAVAAANAAVAEVLAQLSPWCVDAVRAARPA